MSQALPVDKKLWVNTPVDCAPWGGIGMKTKPTVAKEMEKEMATATDGAQMSSIKKANEEEEDKAVNEDDQSNETLNEEGELVEAPENNEKKPENNELKRKNTMINGSTPKKAKQEDVITTVNALKHVQKMKANVAMINASDVEEMDNRN